MQQNTKWELIFLTRSVNWSIETAQNGWGDAFAQRQAGAKAPLGYLSPFFYDV